EHRAAISQFDLGQNRGAKAAQTQAGEVSGFRFRVLSEVAFELRRLHPKHIRVMRGLNDGGADSFRSEKCREPRQCFMEMIWIAQCRFKQTKLLRLCLRRRGAQSQ